MKKSILLTMIAVILAVPVGAQTTKPATRSVSGKPVPAAQAVPVSPNEEIIKLTTAGMSEEIILAVVARTDKTKYDTSADALLKLKSAGVTQKVIAAILGVTPLATPSASVPAQGVSGASPAVNPTTQRLAVSLEQTSTQSVEGREAGIYLETAAGEVQLEPAVFSGGKTGNKFLGSITGLAKSSIKAVVRSEKANQRLQTAVPVFYFYFENKGAGLSNTGGMFTGFMNGASSPNEFVLARMKVDKNERSLVTSESWAFSDRSGVRSKDTVDIRVERVSTGVYKVTPQTSLTAGEYCFFYAVGNLDKDDTGKLFDFGVDPGAVTK